MLPLSAVPHIWVHALLRCAMLSVITAGAAVTMTAAESGERAPAVASSSPPDVSAVVGDAETLRSHWAASPFPALWGHNGLAGVRKRVGEATERLAPGGGFWRLLADLHAMRCDGCSTLEGNGAWRLSFDLPHALVDALTAITGSEMPQTSTKVHTAKVGPWVWTWDLTHLDGIYGNAPSIAAGVGAARAPAFDLDCTADFLQLIRHGDEYSSLEVLSALGLTRLHYGASLDATGIADRLELPGFQPPLGTITTADLGGLPEKPLLVMVVNFDGARLAQLLARLRTIPEVADACRHYAAGPAAELGPLEEVARALDGTVVACASTAVPFPNLALSVPATPAMDALVERVAKLLKLPATEARSATAQIPMPGPWPAMLWLRRGARWALSTDMTMADALAAAAPAASLPVVLQEGLGSSSITVVDVPPVAAMAGQFLALALPSTPEESKAGLTIARDFCLVLATRALRVDAALRIDSQGATFTGHTALAAALFPITALVAPSAYVVSVVEAKQQETTKASLQPFQQHAESAGWPERLPDGLLAPPYPAPHLGTRPWALYLAPASAATGDQPVLVSDPLYLGGKILWLTRDGRIHTGGQHAARPLWLAAQRLTTRGGRCSGADWAEALRQQRSLQFADQPTVTNNELNYSMVVPSADHWVERKAKDFSSDCDHLWFNQKADMVFGVIPEKAAEAHEKNWLHDVIMEQKKQQDPQLKVVSDHAITVCGLPARRVRLEATINGVPLRFDDTFIDHHGYLYQVVAWCGAKTTSLADLESTADGLLDRFTVLDTQRTVPGWVDGEAPLAVVHSPHMNLQVDFSGMGWESSAKPKNGNDYIELRGHLSARKAHMYMVTANTGTGTLSDHALVHGLLGLLNVAPTTVTEQHTAATTLGQTILLRYPLGEGADQYACRAWLIRAGSHAVAIVVNGLATDHVSDEVGDALIARVTFTPAAAAGAPAPAPDGAVDAAFAAAVGHYFTDNKRHLEALPWLVDAARGTHPPVDRLQAVLNCYCQLETWQEALDYYHKAIEPTVDDLGISSFKPWFLVQLKRDAEAIAAYRTLFAAGWKGDEDFAAYIEALHRVASDQVEAAFAANPVPARTSVGRRLHARILSRDGKAEQAERDLRADVAAAPSDLSLAEALADNLLEQDQPAAAREFLAEVLKEHARAAALWHLAGICDFRTDRFHEATTDFKTELDLDPAAQPARDYLNAINQKLGKGDTSRIAKPIAPVAGISELAPATQAAPPGGAYALRAAALSWSPKSGFLRSDRAVISIPDRAACETFSTLRYGFDPDGEDFAINAVIVRDQAGAVLSEGRIEDWYVLDDSKSDIASTKKTVSIPVAGLRPGCTIDCLTTRRQGGATAGMPFVTVDIGGQMPTMRSCMSLRAPADRIAALAGGGLRLERDGDVLRVEATALPGRHWEPYTPDTRRDQPVIWLGPRGGSWAELGRKYLAELKPFLADQPAVSALAETTCKGVVGRDARIAALADLVQSRIAYHAVTFGNRGRIPQPAATILERRLGDCKDHALLLQRLLAAAGIPAFLALAPSNAMVFDEMPDLDQFDHMVVVVPAAGDAGAAAGAQPGLQVIDTTDKDGDLSLPPAGLANRQLLLLDPAGPHLVATPAPGQSHVTVDRTWTIALDGSVRCDETVSVAGYWASYFREHLSGKQPDERRRVLLDELGHSLSTVTALEVADLEDLRKPLKLALSYTMRDALPKADGRLSGSIPEPWYTGLWEWSVRRGEERRRPLFVRFPLTVTITSRLHHPGLRAGTVPVGGPDDDDDFVSLQHVVGADGAATVTIAQHAGEFPAARYGAWCDRFDALGRRLQLAVSLAPEAAAPPDPLMPAPATRKYVH